MKLLHKNTLSGVGQLVLTAGLTFFSIPLFIKTLGAEAYGAFSIVTLAGNLNIFANLGLNTALLKFLSVQGKSRESDHDIAVTYGLLLIIMVPLSVLVISLQQYILQDFLGLSNELYTKVKSLYNCVVVANLILLLGQTCTTILDSQQRMYQTNFYQLVYSVLYWGGLIIVVSLGYDMTAVGIVILASAIFWFVLVMIAAGRVWGVLQLDGLRTNVLRIARKQISYSSNVYTAGLLVMMFEPMTKILIARLIGVREVGYIEIAYKVRAQLWSFVTKVTYPIYPKIAREVDFKRLSIIIGGYQTVMLLVMIPILFFIAITLEDFFSLWLPQNNDIIITSTLFISLTFIINSLSVPPYYFLMSSHYVHKTIWIQLTNVGINLITILLTYRLMGIYGFVMGNSFAIFSSLALCLYYQKKFLHKISIDITQTRNLIIITLFTGLISVFVNSYLTKPLQRIGFTSVMTIINYLICFRHSYKSLLKISLLIK